MPEVTVVIPTHDRWDMLSTGALPASLGQNDVDLEVVVVDDGSNDLTPERLAAVPDARLRIIRHERPRGVAQARNAGIHAANGEWIAFLDDDDLWAPDKLRLQVDAAHAARADFVYAASAALNERRRFLYSLELADPDQLAVQILRQNVIWAGSSNVVARADLVRRLGGFDERLFQLCDWDMWIRLALAGRAAACPEILVGCVIQPRSMLLTDKRDVFREMDYLVQKHRDASARHEVEFEHVLFSRWVADGHLRAGRRLRAAATYLQAARRHRDLTSIGRAFPALFGETVMALTKRLLLGRTVPREARAVAEPSWLAAWQEQSPLPNFRS
jgi:glycosyltransferase involved in cell wall biosynthesis